MVKVKYSLTLFHLFLGEQQLCGQSTAPSAGLSDDSQLTLVDATGTDDEDFECVSPPDHLYPKGWKEPWHCAWLYNDDAYMGYYLQATKGDLTQVRNEDDSGEVMGMLESYNYTAHKACRGMT